MSRRRKPRSNRALYRANDGLVGPAAAVRFRLVCRCQEPPVIVQTYYSERMRDGSWSALESFVKEGDGGEYTETNVDEHESGATFRSQWRCPVCGFTVRPSKAAMDKLQVAAAALKKAGQSDLDIRAFAGHM